jgi:cellulose synthase/poly-beta-1,6-N-acetylglucosamine synthase-like glycosyltransferase
VSLDVTVIAWLMLAIAMYYVALFALSHRPRASGPSGDRPLIVLMIPAHNEQLVIEATLSRLLLSPYERKLILVMNDGSTDETSSLARAVGEGQPVHVVDRPPTLAGRGKGAVLNHGLSVLVHDILVRDPLAPPPDEVVVGVMDADGQLDMGALDAIAPFFSDARVGAVQIGVRIVNATDGLLQRAQDIEFVGFSGFVQTARDALGSVGLGGNGQFTRLSALIDAGPTPWSACLTEDLDLGLALVERGWRIRFCTDVFVAQQAVDNLAALLRQRTRWVQGHYQCWSHFPQLLRARGVPWRTKLDLALYLGLLVMVVVFAANAALSVAQLLGVLNVYNGVLAAIHSAFGQRALVEGVSLGPPLCFITTYQVRAAHRLPWWAVPAAIVFFVIYTYLFVICHFWAWARLLLRRANWAKTARVVTEAASMVSVQTPDRQRID